MEQHFVCPACAATSKVSGNCSTEGCHRNGQPMEGCTCTDGTHSMVLNENA